MYVWFTLMGRKLFLSFASSQLHLLQEPTRMRGSYEKVGWLPALPGCLRGRPAGSASFLLSMAVSALSFSRPVLTGSLLPPAEVSVEVALSPSACCDRRLDAVDLDDAPESESADAASLLSFSESAASAELFFLGNWFAFDAHESVIDSFAFFSTSASMSMERVVRNCMITTSFSSFRPCWGKTSWCTSEMAFRMALLSVAESTLLLNLSSRKAPFKLSSTASAH
mmetsp:Transcript_152692/g.266106  ORF Transcript_152692/g.266106 Transcript_152692/m.266106 type:complete len:225 (-) Transcript_152692:318-992(-)